MTQKILQFENKNFITPEHWNSEELEDESLDELGLKDVAKGDPVKELQQGV